MQGISAMLPSSWYKTIHRQISSRARLHARARAARGNASRRAKDGFLLNTLKTPFRLPRVLLDI